MNIERPILIVDDDSDLLELFGIALKRLNMPIIKASSGKQALELLNTETPRLILLDVAMPSVTGLDVLQKIRADSRFNETKVVMLTAVPNLIDQQSIGMVSRVLVKPIAPIALESNIREVLAE
ncbi:MAG TPA: response regulator [Aggregatilineales bacterium]|nr:response regulator [Anaerolineales bacterium]HRE49198.1 response regulator [Aggregatilineales bacterium]